MHACMQQSTTPLGYCELPSQWCLINLSYLYNKCDLPNPVLGKSLLISLYILSGVHEEEYVTTRSTHHGYYLTIRHKHYSISNVTVVTLCIYT